MKIVYSDTRKPSTAQVRELYRYTTWASKRPAAAITQALRHSDLIFSAWQGKQLVGFCRVSTDFSFRAVLWDVIVHPDFYRQGIGGKLVQRVLKHRRLKPIDGFWLFTTDKQAFYKKLGFALYPKNLMVLRKRRS